MLDLLAGLTLIALIFVGITADYIKATPEDYEDETER